MVITRTKVCDSLIWLATTFMLFSFLAFDQYSWGKYLFLLCSALIFSLNVIKKGLIIHIRFSMFLVFIAAFMLWIALTAIWSINYTETLTIARTMLSILICFSLIYWTFMDETNPEHLLTSIIFASYFVGIYALFFYGFDNIISASDDVLLGTSFANVNSIALFVAFGFVCDFYLTLYSGPKLYSLLSVISVVIVAACRSRKAIFFIVIGVIALTIFRFSNSKSLLYRALKIVFWLICLLTVIYFIAKMPIFTAVNKRIDLMINTFMNKSTKDTSSLIRNDLISLGHYYWLKRPLHGYGFAATHIIAYKNLNFDSYLHNNYIEVLVSGGIMGFVTYYSMYVYLIIGYIKIRAVSSKWFVLGIVIIGLLLIMDYGRVSYYSKTVYFELMFLFVVLENVRFKGDSEETKIVEPSD